MDTKDISHIGYLSCSYIHHNYLWWYSHTYLQIYLLLEFGKWNSDHIIRPNEKVLTLWKIKISLGAPNEILFWKSTEHAMKIPWMNTKENSVK